MQTYANINMTRWKIMLMTDVEQTKGNEGSYL
jgi:hypothetical protein